MLSARLQIDTNINRITRPSSRASAARERSVTPSSARGKPSLSSNAANGKRMRSASNASSTSNLSVISPISSSSAESSPRLPAGRGSSLDSTSSAPTSPMLDETIRLAPSEYVLAMHDFAPEHQNANCLSFQAGQVIHVLNRDNSGWWDGELEGKRGWFPSNYVNEQSPNTSLRDEEPPNLTRRRYDHNRKRSSMSAVSWASTPASLQSSRSDHRPLVTETLGSDVDSYCPPLMVPLLQGISVLQSAVRSGRIAHFEASTACIISRVKSVLGQTGCLGRDSRLLKDHPSMFYERKAMLSDLASLVSLTRSAVLTDIDEEARESFIEDMLKTAGQVFSHTRRFLAIAVQCGVDLSIDTLDSEFGGSNDTERRWSGEDMMVAGATPTSRGIDQYISPRTSNERRPMRDRNGTIPLDQTPRAKSTGDLKTPRKSSTDEDTDSIMPLLPNRNFNATSKREYYWLRGRNGGHRPMESSSSISSYGSLEHAKPAVPPLPQGPSSTAQVVEALRLTHDHYLSTIAAFIGHAHSHSRSSHASTTDKIYDLVDEIVDMVCKLLTIVESVMRLPDLPIHKQIKLSSAKEGLFNVTSALAEAVRALEHELPETDTEEDEKNRLLASATGALKAGADCVSAVRTCLHRSLGEKAFIIYMPSPGEPDASMFTPSKFNKGVMGQTRSDNALNAQYQYADEEDATVHAKVARAPGHKSRESSEDSNDSLQSRQSSRASHEANVGPARDHKRLPPSLKISHEPVEQDLISPASVAHTEDDRTTWAGSQRHHRASSADTKIYNGNLPPVPFSEYNAGPQDHMAWMFTNEYPMDDIAYNSEGHIVGATLNVLVTKMTPHDSIVDGAFSAIFFLTFRLFASPNELVEALVARYNVMPPLGAQEHEQHEWQQRKGIPIRLRVTNIIKQWVEMYWRPAADNSVIPHLTQFVRDALSPMFPSQCNRILEAIAAREQVVDHSLSPKGDRARDPGMSINPPALAPSEVPRPTMTKTLLAALRGKNFASISITDFDSLELARQMTIMENNLYMAILPQELLETGQQGVKSPITVKAVSSLSTTITGWVAESILNEHDIKKRTSLVKFFIKVADRCTSLNNYSTPRSILAALDSSTISRLHQTWLGLPQKNRIQLEALRRLADHGRNYNEYRTRLKNTAPPGVPFLGLYLTDVTFCREGNPNFRPSPSNPDKKLLNFNKYHKLARIVQDMQRFQVPYNLKEIPEVQEYLNGAFENAKHHGDLQDLYRRSLLVEPKQPADNPPGPPTSDMRQLFSWATRSQNQQPSPINNLPA